MRKLKSLIVLTFVSILVLPCFSIELQQKALKIKGKIVKVVPDASRTEIVIMTKSGDKTGFQRFNLDSETLDAIFSIEKNCIDFTVFPDFLIILTRDSILYVPRTGGEPTVVQEISTIFPFSSSYNFKNKFIFKLTRSQYGIYFPEDTGCRLYIGDKDKIANPDGIYIPGNAQISFSESYVSIPPVETITYQFGYLHLFNRGGKNFATVVNDQGIKMYELVDNERLKLEKEINWKGYEDHRYIFRDVNSDGQLDLVLFSDIYSSTGAEIYLSGDISSKPSYDRLIENAIDIHSGNLDTGTSSDQLIIYFKKPETLKQYISRGEPMNIYFVPRIQWETGRYKRVSNRALQFVSVNSNNQLYFLLNNLLLKDITGDGLSDFVYFFNAKLFIHINGENFEISDDPTFTLDFKTFDRIDYLFSSKDQQNHLLIFTREELNILSFF